MLQMNRRRLLASCSASLALLGSGVSGVSSVSGAQAASADSGLQALLLSAASQDGENGRRVHQLQAFALSAKGLESHFSLALPGRGHHVAVSPEQGLFIAVARRPERWLVVGDLASGALLQTLMLPEGRHFQGHGIFSPDGATFWTVESAYDALDNNGRIGRWQVDRHADPIIRQQGLFETKGTGAHELTLMPDNKTLVVANGGIKTHPEQDRDKLNLNDMQPSLVYLDGANGTLLEQVQMPAQWHQNSIRHLDVNAEGEVAFATQYEGAPFDEVPLLAVHRRGEALHLPAIDASIQRRMKQYCGSVRFDASGRYLAVSCPRGDMLMLWDVRDEQLVETLRVRDVCGISACGSGFLYTTGTGLVGMYDLDARRGWLPESTLDESWGRTMWDNHLSIQVNI